MKIPNSLSAFFFFFSAVGMNRIHCWDSLDYTVGLVLSASIWWL